MAALMALEIFPVANVVLKMAVGRFRPNSDLNLVERREVLDAQTRSTIQALHLMRIELKLHVLKLWH